MATPATREKALPAKRETHLKGVVTLPDLEVFMDPKFMWLLCRLHSYNHSVVKQDCNEYLETNQESLP